MTAMNLTTGYPSRRILNMLYCLRMSNLRIENAIEPAAKKQELITSDDGHGTGR